MLGLTHATNNICISLNRLQTFVAAFSGCLQCEIQVLNAKQLMQMCNKPTRSTSSSDFFLSYPMGKKHLATSKSDVAQHFASVFSQQGINLCIPSTFSLKLSHKCCGHGLGRHNLTFPCFGQTPLTILLQNVLVGQCKRSCVSQLVHWLANFFLIGAQMRLHMFCTSLDTMFKTKFRNSCSITFSCSHIWKPGRSMRSFIEISILTVSAVVDKPIHISFSQVDKSHCF